METNAPNFQKTLVKGILKIVISAKLLILCSAQSQTYILFLQFVELVIHTSLDAKDLILALYNGANGRMYRSLNLADREAFTVTEGSSDYLLYTVRTPLQNGPADGIALVYCRDMHQAEVLEFLSYEGSLRAEDGPAKGLVSTDIMIKETDESSNQGSLGLTGSKILEFAWKTIAGSATPGKLNAGQMF